MVTDIKFTLVVSKDINELLQLAEVIWFPAYQHSHSENKLKYLFDKMYNKEEIVQQINLKKKLFYFIKNSSSEKIGYFAIEPLEFGLVLDKVYVVQSLQKSGVGSTVIDFIKRFAKKKHLGFIRLNVNRKNTNAIHFYKKHLFNIIDEIDIQAGNGFVFDDYVMQYDL
jgi:diamine N-acetyltransferase